MHQHAICCIVLLFNALCITRGSEDLTSVEDTDVPEWVSNGGFLILIFAVYVSLWGSALVCEDYFVPAMNKLCLRFEIRDDVAGATLLAVGNSAPQVFISLVSIFITKSSLGLGTALGTACFNHLCVCGVCSVSAKSGSIPLSWRPLLRDCCFYCAALLLLIWALEGSVVEAVLNLNDKDIRNGQVEIRLDAVLLFIAVYIAYILTCTYYSRILTYLFGRSARGYALSSAAPSRGGLWTSLLAWMPHGRGREQPEVSEWTVVGQDEHSMPLLHRPAGASHMGRDRNADFDILAYTDDLDTELLTRRNREQQQSPYSKSASSAASMSPNCDSLSRSEEDSDAVCTADLMLGAAGSDTYESFSEAVRSPGMLPPPLRQKISGRYQCWLLKRSSFYSRLRISSRKWQLRFFVLDDGGLRYYRGPGDKQQCKYINIFEASSVSLPRSSTLEDASEQDVADLLMVFRVVTPDKTYTLRALTPSVYRRLVSILRKRIAIYQSYPSPLRRSMAELQGSRHARAPKLHGTTSTLNRIDFVDDTIDAASGRPQESPFAEEQSVSDSMSDDSENDFDDSDNVWDELARYADAAESENDDNGSVRSLSSQGSQGLRHYISRRRKECTAAVLRLLGLLSFASGQVMRPLKWCIRRTILPVLIEDDARALSVNFDSDLSADNDISDHRGEEDKKLLNPMSNRNSSSGPYFQSESLQLMCTIATSIVWMGILSYILAVAVELFGHFIHLTSAVTGLTLAAMGSNFSSLLTSIIATHQGQGDMAVSNAMGSNVFCILIGLGLPWLIAIVGQNGAPYGDIEDDGVVAAAMLLLLVLASFWIVLSMTGFVMYRWMGYTMLVIYFAIVTYLLIFST